jgi:ferredoxin-fold anticodon binding domain-containing protein
LSTEEYSDARESYQAAVPLKNLIDEYLLHKEKRDKFNDKIRAGGKRRMTQVQVDKENETLKYEKKRLDKRKVDVLNEIIFPSMANLTVLLEKMKNEPYICDIFECDIKALFLTESAETEGQAKVPIFLRFVRACVSKPQTENTTVVPDFRFILAFHMQHTVCEMIKMEASYQLEREEKHLYEVVLHDMLRSLAWTQFFSREARGSSKFRKDRRPALF